MKSGVYLIKNIVNGKVYIGSSKYIYRRRQRHLNCIRHNRVKSIDFGKDVREYGERAFVFGIIEYSPVQDILSRESFWIHKFESYKFENGYNHIDPVTNKIISDNYHFSSKKRSISYILINKLNGVVLTKLGVELIEFGIPKNKIHKLSSYWRDAKGSKRAHNGWMLIKKEDYNPNFDYIGYNKSAEYWRNYIKKPKKAYNKKKAPEDIIPMELRNFNRKTVVIKSIETGEEFEYPSFSDCVRKLNLVSSKAQKCINRPFGQNQHRGYHFRWK